MRNRTADLRIANESFLAVFKRFQGFLICRLHLCTSKHHYALGQMRDTKTVVLFWSSNLRLENTSLLCLSEYSHTPPAPRLRLLWVGVVSLPFSFQFFKRFERRLPHLDSFRCHLTQVLCVVWTETIKTSNRQFFWVSWQRIGRRDGCFNNY